MSRGRSCLQQFKRLWSATKKVVSSRQINVPKFLFRGSGARYCDEACACFLCCVCSWRANGVVFKKGLSNEKGDAEEREGVEYVTSEMSLRPAAVAEEDESRMLKPRAESLSTMDVFALDSEGD